MNPPFRPDLEDDDALVVDGLTETDEELSPLLDDQLLDGDGLEGEPDDRPMTAPPGRRSRVGRLIRAVRTKSPAQLLRLARHRVRVRRRRLRRSAKVYRRLLQKERQWRVPFSKRRVRWWRHGFLSRSAVLYRLDENGPDDYISDVQRYRSTRRMVHPRLQDVINNKLTTHLLLRSIDVRSADLLGIYWRGAVHTFPTEDRIVLDEYLASLSDGERVFIKPLTGAEGRRLYSIRRTGELFRINGQDRTLDEARALVERGRRPMVVERGIEQHPEVAALFPETVNTIRILTMLDLDDRRPFIAAAVQRIGTERSGHVDNWSQGGLSARIDIATGQLGPATWLPTDGDDSLAWFDHHPETGARIAGVTLPHWQMTVDTIIHAASVTSFLEYVGWDVIIGPDGPVVLEANINSGMNVLQVHHPLLADPRARRYFAKRGVVPH